MADDVTDPKTGQLIYPGFQRGPGLHNATSYQVSAIPFLTGNLYKHQGSMAAQDHQSPRQQKFIFLLLLLGLRLTT